MPSRRERAERFRSGTNGRPAPSSQSQQSGVTRTASVAVIVDAKDRTGVAFYLRYGFISFPDQPLRLFLPMKTIADLESS